MLLCCAFIGGNCIVAMREGGGRAFFNQRKTTRTAVESPSTSDLLESWAGFRISLEDAPHAQAPNQKCGLEDHLFGNFRLSLLTTVKNDRNFCKPPTRFPDPIGHLNLKPIAVCFYATEINCTQEAGFVTAKAGSHVVNGQVGNHASVAVSKTA